MESLSLNLTEKKLGRLFNRKLSRSCKARHRFPQSSKPRYRQISNSRCSQSRQRDCFSRLNRTTNRQRESFRGLVQTSPGDIHKGSVRSHLRWKLEILDKWLHFHLQVPGLDTMKWWSIHRRVKQHSRLLLIINLTSRGMHIWYPLL